MMKAIKLDKIYNTSAGKLKAKLKVVVNDSINVYYVRYGSTVAYPKDNVFFVVQEIDNINKEVVIQTYPSRDKIILTKDNIIKF